MFSPVRLCGIIPRTWIYSHLPASLNKRLKRRGRCLIQKMVPMSGKLVERLFRKKSSTEFNRAKEPYLLKKCGLVKFGRKSGKAEIMMEGTCPVLYLWAYWNITEPTDVAIWCKETGEVLFYLEGNHIATGKPNDLGFKPDNMKITDLCPNLAEV